jgi:hypothetical protein
MQRPDAPEATTRIDPPASREATAGAATSSWTRPEPPREPAAAEPPPAEPPPSAEQPPRTETPPRTEQATPPRKSPNDQWSNVTQSTSDAVRPYSEPPTEITLPRAPQPTAELPPPGSPPASTGRLPLPEERESDES